MQQEPAAAFLLNPNAEFPPHKANSHWVERFHDLFTNDIFRLFVSSQPQGRPVDEDDCRGSTR
jgi:hypothetical protein